MGKEKEYNKSVALSHHKNRARRRKSAAVCQKNPLNTEKEKNKYRGQSKYF
jgi:hypothetical protein